MGAILRCRGILSGGVERVTEGGLVRGGLTHSSGTDEGGLHEGTCRFFFVFFVLDFFF